MEIVKGPWEYPEPVLIMLPNWRKVAAGRRIDQLC
jgi:hypothetical protein